jgi:Fe-S cluster biogenesis protein NfuA
MDLAEIRITAEPIDNQRCKFVVNVPVLEGGVRRFSDIEEAAGSPLAEAIFAIPGLAVNELIVSGNIVTVSKQSQAPWQTAGRAVGAAIRSALAGAAPAIAPAPSSPPAAKASGESPGEALDDDALYERVAKVFDEQVNPMVARHGGHVELIDVQDAVVMLRMGGGCQGCGMADVTLRQGIEGMLGQLVPAVRGIVDITDHTTGANPYFQASKK